MSRRLVVFTRVPRLGEVKTRLARAIGEHAALAAHRQLLARTLSVAASVPRARKVLCIEGEDRDGECAAWATRIGAHLARQVGEDLGQRMRNAIAEGCAAGEATVLIGSDCPVLDTDALVRAFDALEVARAVFAPAQDGGYALVGARSRVPEVFEGIAWGTASVMALTRARLRVEGCTWVELDPVWDVDELPDWERWLGMPGPRTR